MDDILVGSVNGAQVERLVGPSLERILEEASSSMSPQERVRAEFRVTMQGVEAEAAVSIMDGLTASGFWQYRRGTGQAAGVKVRFSL